MTGKELLGLPRILRGLGKPQIGLEDNPLGRAIKASHSAPLPPGFLIDLGLSPPPIVPPPPTTPPSSLAIPRRFMHASPQVEPSIPWSRMIVAHLLKKKPEVTAGRVLPGIDDIAVMEGRRIRGAFVYSDLHGFSKLVATQPEQKSFVFLNTFVEMASRLTRHYNGQIMDVAGDRVLSVFHRPPGDRSNEPVEDAVTFALWLQAVFNKVIGPAFAGGGLGQLSLGIGIDYGEAVVGCVGIRNAKRIVFFGDAPNHAAHLQESAGASETLVSAAADVKRPVYLDNGNWNIRRERLPSGEVVLRIADWLADELPPKLR